MGSGATLFQAGKGGELQDTRDQGPHLATRSTDDNCAGITSVPWSLSHRPHPRCAPKLSAARRELVWGLSEDEVHGGGGNWGPQSAAQRRWASRRPGRSRRGASGRGMECCALQGGLWAGSRRWVLRMLWLWTRTGKGLQVEGVAWEKLAWSRRSQRSVPDHHAPASPLQMRPFEVRLEVGWG